MNIRYLRGISAWSRTGALRAVIGDVPERPVDAGRLQHLEAELSRLCLPPHLARMTAARGSQGRMPRDSGQLLVELTGELYFLCGEFHGARNVPFADSPGSCTLVLECREFALAEACMRAAVLTVNALLSGTEPTLNEMYAALLKIARQVSPLNSPGLVTSAAADRGIPVIRLGPDHSFGLAPDEVLQFGEGIHQKRLHPWGTMTDGTGYLAGHLANDKAFVKTLWSQCGIPVPEGRVVSDESSARAAAVSLGGPIIVKPVDSQCGQGLTIKPATPEAVSAAFHHARAASTSGQVLVERYIAGSWHRLLVINRRLVAAVRREPARVVGDGQHTVRELVEMENGDSRRGPDDRWPLQFFALEEIELERLGAAGLTCESILPSGARFHLRQTASAATGAASIDVTEQIHPETCKFALDAVALVGLDIAGLDLIADDISQPLAGQHGAFLEINEQPAIFMHDAPLSSPPRPVGEAIVDSLFAGGRDGRVPLVAVIGNRTADRVAELLFDRLSATGRVIGLSTPHITRIGDRPAAPGRRDLPERLSTLWRHSRTEAAIVSGSLEDVVHSGLGSDHSTVLVLVEGRRDGAVNGKRVLPEEVDRLIDRLVLSADRVVVNASDPFWQVSNLVGRPHVLMLTDQADQPRVCQHLRAGGMAAMLEASGVTLQRGGTTPHVYPRAAGPDAGPDTPLAFGIATATSVLLNRVVGISG